MHNTSYFPLRTSAGASLLIEEPTIVAFSPELASSERAVASFAYPPDAYDKFVPNMLRIGNVDLTRGNGVASMPAPDIGQVVRGPFHPNDHFWRLWVVGPDVEDDPPRKHWIEVELTLSEKQGDSIIGGIVYGGHPMLPYYVLPHGANSSNFGLPRELRISWESGETRGFLDSEVAVVQQEITSHSGVHFLATGPVRARKLRLRLADFPRIIRRIVRTADWGIVNVEEFWGILIPYLGVVSYVEDVRYTPGVPAGLLAATHHPPEHVNQSYLDPNTLTSNGQQRMAGVTTDLVYVTPRTLDTPGTPGLPARYWPLSAASLFHTGRQYAFASDPMVPPVREVFISQGMRRDDQVRIYFAQGEEHRRPLGGLRITGIDEKTETFGTPKAGQFDVAIYELDPVEGVSPLAPERDPAKDKYSTLVYRGNQLSFGRHNCAFLRPSTARNLVVVFTCREDGHLRLRSMELVQSAHVFVAPRTSRRQQMRQLNFRLIGPNLAEDYSRIGRDGFKFSIEHVVGGELKETLFEARALTDLLQLNGVRLYANQRYLETKVDVSRERTETLPNSYERRYNQVGSHGWRRSQGGDTLAWSPVEPKVHLQHYGDDPGDGSFRSYSNGESRSRTEHLGLMAGVNGPLLTALDTIRGLLTLVDESLFNLPAANSLIAGTGWGTGAGQFWEGFSADQLGGIGGLLNVSSPPVPIDSTIYKSIRQYFSNPAAINSPEYLAALNLSEFILLNGVGFGLNVGLGYGPVSVSGSVSTSQLLPSVTRTSATGATGTITLSAGKTGRSYTQNLNDGYDESESYTALSGGIHNREVVRDLLRPGTRRERTPGVNIHWQEQVLDLVVGAVPLSVSLPAMADKVYAARDEWVRIRFGNGMRDGLRTLLIDQPSGEPDVVMDVWFDLKEEVVQDDY